MALAAWSCRAPGVSRPFAGRPDHVVPRRVRYIRGTPAPPVSPVALVRRQLPPRYLASRRCSAALPRPRVKLREAAICRVGAGGFCCAGAGAREDELGAVGAVVSVSLRCARAVGWRFGVLRLWWGCGQPPPVRLRPVFGASGRLFLAGMSSRSERSDDPEMDDRSANEPVSESDEDSDAGAESGPDDGTGADVATAAATAAVGGAVGGTAAALATGAGGVGVAMAGGAVGVAAGPVIVGGALVGAGTVLALKGLGVPVDEAAARAMKTAKEAAAKAAPAVSKGSSRERVCGW